MATKNDTPEVSAEQWETIDEGTRTRVTFDEIGDEFIGVWEGPEVIMNPATDEEMHYLNFRGISPEEIKDEPAAISAGYQLTETMKKVPVGTTVRITLRSETKMGPGRNPLKNFVVQTKRS
jgi:hypothetical protein